MPQQSLIPEYPPMTEIDLVVRSFPLTAHPDEAAIIVRVGTGGKDPKSVVAITLVGYERDLLNTMVSEVISAYMYGETRKDVVRAAFAVKKQARAHSLAHQF